MKIMAKTSRTMKAQIFEPPSPRPPKTDVIDKIHVLSAIDDSVLESVFGWTKLDVRRGQALEAMFDFSENTTENIATVKVQKMFWTIAHPLFKAIPMDRVREVKSTNPFTNWTRDEQGFHNKDKVRKYPTGNTKAIDDVDGNEIAYIIKGYGDKGGANSSVHPFVAYRNKACVIKIMELSTQYSFFDQYINTKDVFELVTQVYLHEALQKSQSSEWAKRLSIPKILYVQRVEESLHVCMERIHGDLLHLTEYPWMALAYTMKALYFLQQKFYFMHRDFHGMNVAYDHVKKKVEIIDFGMACVNPEGNDVSWQSNVDWYPPVSDSEAVRCTNRSYDVCVLLSSLYGRQTGGPDYVRFTKVIQKEIRQRMSQVVKEELNKTGDRPAFDFTQMDNFDSPGWRVGNKTKSFHFMYDLNEYPCEDFYPERVLARLMEHIPLSEWSGMRKGWAHLFDDMTSKLSLHVSVKETDLHGHIIQCNSDGTFKVRVGTEDKRYTPEQVTICPKPTTKEELRTWLEEYCEGVTSHGEPNTWDVTSVTDMSELFAGLGTV